MENLERWDAPEVVPSIPFRDVGRAVDWLERAFGFRERAGSRLTWPGGEMTWMDTGEGLIHLTTPDATWGDDPDVGASGFVLKVYVADVDDHFHRAKLEGAEIVSKPENGFWGGRIYRARDHERNRWEFSQQGADLSPRHWQLPPGVSRKE